MSKCSYIWEQFSSVQSLSMCLTLCDPMNCSTPGLPVHHQLPEFTQTPIHKVRDAEKRRSCVRGLMGTCQMTQAYATAAPTIWKFIFRSQSNFAWLCPQSQNCLFGTIECISQIEFCKFSSVSQSCPTLCDPMNRSTPGLPVYHQLPEFTQTLVHRVSDAIQPSHPRSSPSPSAPNPSQHQSLFQ